MKLIVKINPITTVSEFIISDIAASIFGDDVEVEVESGAETECIFPDGTDPLTEQAASILAAHFTTAVDNAVEEWNLPVFAVSTVHADDSHPDNLATHSYREVLAMYPWMLSILPTDWDEQFNLSWTSGLTRTQIKL